MDSPSGAYDFRAIEAYWQAYWLEHRTHRTPNPGDEGFDPTKPKSYVLDMFPYPSGVGLHVGHPLGYIATDVFARYKRMRGFNVLHPMGYDAFGLPAEQFAVEHGVPPRVTTEKNIDNIRQQFRRLGQGYDRDRELATIDVEYYRWTQWIFLQLFNSWYDKGQDRARPIADLIHELENEHFHVAFDGTLVHAGAAAGIEALTGGPTGARLWHELSPAEQRDVIDSHRLAYVDEVAVNWCPALGTVLANEEVTSEGRSERGNHPVYRRPLKQWMLRITEYADRLERELALVDWPESVRLMQRNWIGRSTGAYVDFAVASSATENADAEAEEDLTIRVYTTRPDTLFGATYMVLAPEHELVDRITIGQQRDAVRAYVEAAGRKSDLERTAETKTKTGVFTGAYAINPVNGERIPIWVADYVLAGYGTGAIMAVPGHDTRDLEFAEAFGLVVREVVRPTEEGVDWRGFVGDGVSVNSPGEGSDKAALPVGYCELNGLPTPAAKRRITEWLEEEEVGQAAVNYKLRDWLFSRQRYWGEPFPIVHDVVTGDVYALDEAELPVELPEMDDFTPATSDDPEAPPQPPLGRASDWVNVEGWVTERGLVRLVRAGQVASAGAKVRKFKRELNTMPQWAGSCWYYLRYIDKKNDKVLVDPEAERYWMAPRRPDDPGARPGSDKAGGVDLYVGGVEHAVLHLLYSRFWHKVLYDLGYVSSPEPFGRLFNQGYIQGYYYEDARGVRRPAAEVVNQDGKPASGVQGTAGQQYFHNGDPVTEKYGKMGKSLKNAVAPDDIIAEHGADTLRAYELYLGPLEASKPWSTRDMIGMSRFLSSVWRKIVAEDGSLRVRDDEPDAAVTRKLHQTIQKVGALMDDLRFNTAIAALIELNNVIKGDGVPRAVAEPMVLMLSPFAPHMCEELWRRIKGEAWTDSIVFEPWPAFDPKLAKEDEIEIPVQVKGKLRSRIRIPADADEGAMKEAALADEKIQQEIAGKEVVKLICVKGRLVNVVVK
jgi:leucyl-tRNA synthetase